jgi:endonuclease/exonuclease/phosphatase family metal-dependent hydrolase
MRSVLAAIGVTAIVLGAFTAVHQTPPPPQQVTLATVDPDAGDYQRESIRMMTWNICGEAGGSRGSSSYCAWRARPQAKAAAIETIVRQRDLNVVALQEVCYPDPANGRGGDLNDLAPLMAALGPEWTYRTAAVPRPDATSHCRGGNLVGTLGEVLAVRGTIASSTVTPLLVAGDPNYYPDPTTKRTSSLLCVRVDGWQNTPCVVHLLHTSDPEYARETASLKQKIGSVTSPVLAGDFNTSQGSAATSPIRPLFDTYPECDQQAYAPGDTVNETTHYTSTTDAPAVTATKLDYVFASSGFAACDSLTEFATGGANVPGADDPAGLSDHAPVVAVTRGSALTWKFDETDGTRAADISGNGINGTLGAGVTHSTERAHSLRFTGAGALTSDTDTLNRFDTRHSLTVSIWAKPDAGAPTGSLLRQDGNAVAPIDLSYNGGLWQFSLATDDVPGATIDRVGVPAATGVWTHLLATYDAVAGKMSLAVNGTAAGTATHTSRAPSGVRLTVGAAWRGAIDDLQLFPYVLTSAEITKLRSGQAMLPAVPTGTVTVPATGSGDPGCHQNGGYGTVASLTPRLSAYVQDGDPTVPVRGEFSIWDNTDPNQPQPLYLGGPGSASTYVTGAGTVSVPVPTLISGHSYGWYARSSDGTTTSATAPVCHFVAS